MMPKQEEMSEELNVQDKQKLWTVDNRLGFVVNHWRGKPLNKDLHLQYFLPCP